MSAPIDDLLYGGDSGDEDDMNSVPMSSYSAPLPMTSALPLSAPPSATPLGPPASMLVPPPPGVGLSAPLPMNPASVSAPASTMAAARPATAAVPAGAAPVKQQGSGHQMFQQMFALLKQMLPAEQYAALHQEMRNGNGNDIKSIVDIIKRIAGDAIFASVIQKMDLTRNHSAAAGSLGIVKSEPTASTIPTTATGTVTASPPTQTQVARAMPLARSSPPPPAASALPMTTMSNTLGAPLAPPAIAMQRPTLVAAAQPPAASTTVKPEPISATGTPPTTSSTTSTTPTTSSPATATTAAGASDSQEKIQFAKKLLFHASTCVLMPGVCQVKRCDDVRRVFKHSASCGGARGCSHCKQLRALVEYHAKECLVAVGEHCKIPFCDTIRQHNAAARARAASTAGSTATTTTTATAVAPVVAPPSAPMSDDDEDNTPLASAVNKAKKNAKAKSPKASPGASSSSSASHTTATATTAAKKKTTSTTAAKPTTPTTTTATTTAAAAATAATAAAAKPKASSSQAQEYGRLLQLILHVEKCKTSTCFVGEECVEAKTLLRQINAPDAPVRAQTYKKVFAHYKVCVAKNNTQNCPMCRIGLMPLENNSEAAASSSTAPTVSTSSTAATTSTTTSTSVPASSPTVSSLKRSNSTVASPRSPNKKPKTTGKTAVSGKAGDAAGASTTVAADQQPASDLAQASRNDLRKEEDVLTHTAIDLNSERRAMLHGGHRTERLPCQKEAWLSHDLFNNVTLARHMESVARQHGVTLAPAKAVASMQLMAHALQEYLKQVMEEMVEAAKVRGDTASQTLDSLVKKELGAAAMAKRELTSTDILRVSCNDSFARLRMEDLALRSRLLEDAKREELLEKERAKKRKKVDRVKQQAQEEKDEAEMELEELAVSDLKDKLLREDKDGVVGVDGRVNESLATRPTRHVDDQVTMEDATFWLQNQRSYVAPKLFVRADAARIVTKALS